VYELTLTLNASYQSQSFMPSVTFEVTVTDPCLTSTMTAFDLVVGNVITQ